MLTLTCPCVSGRDVSIITRKCFGTLFWNTVFHPSAQWICVDYIISLSLYPVLSCILTCSYMMCVFKLSLINITVKLKGKCKWAIFSIFWTFYYHIDNPVWLNYFFLRLSIRNCLCMTLHLHTIEIYPHLSQTCLYQFIKGVTLHNSAVWRLHRKQALIISLTPFEEFQLIF